MKLHDSNFEATLIGAIQQTRPDRVLEKDAFGSQGGASIGPTS
jgi:hypothetical protein